MFGLCARWYLNVLNDNILGVSGASSGFPCVIVCHDFVVGRLNGSHSHRNLEKKMTSRG